MISILIGFVLFLVASSIYIRYVSEPLTDEAKARILELLSETGEISSRAIQKRLVREGLMTKYSMGVPFYIVMSDYVRDNLVSREVRDENRSNTAVKNTYYSRIIPT